MERLDKFLCDSGIGSRKEVRQMIRSGRVSVNGSPVCSPDFKFSPETAPVELDGTILPYTGFYVLAMNKPAGILSACEDGKQKTVIDLLQDPYRKMDLFPVGRLDKDTTGLLLLTDNGDYAHRVISPKSEIRKKYYALVEGSLEASDVEAFHKGILLRDGLQCLPAEMEILSPTECLVTVMEGKYHQVKRMLASRGKPVLQLRRLSIGALSLPADLPEGTCRELTPAERELVFR